MFRCAKAPWLRALTLFLFHPFSSAMPSPCTCCSLWLNCGCRKDTLRSFREEVGISAFGYLLIPLHHVCEGFLHPAEIVEAAHQKN